MKKTIARLRQDARRKKKRCKEAKRKLIVAIAKAGATALTIILLSFTALAVQPMPNGVRISWEKRSNDVEFAVWMLPPSTTNWVWLSNLTNNTFTFTTPFPDGTMFGVTANQLMTNGVCCVATDVGVALWPPHISTPPKTVAFTPVFGYTVKTGAWIRVSSDLSTFSDWLRFGISGTNVIVEHRVSPERPKLFFSYPTNGVLPPPLPR